MKPYIFNKRVKTKIWVTIQVDPKMKISRRGKIFIDHLTLVENNVETLPHRYYTGIIPVYFHSFNRIKIPFGISNSFQLKGINKKNTTDGKIETFSAKKFNNFQILSRSTEIHRMIILILSCLRQSSYQLENWNFRAKKS